jgi:putative hydrolase of the HAD superfamily
VSGERAVLLDAAGTLIGLREPIGQTYARVARRHGVSVRPDAIEAAFRGAYARASPMLFPDAEPEAIADLERGWWRDVVQSTFRALDAAGGFPDFGAYASDLFWVLGCGAWELRQGAADALAQLRASGWRLALVSNFDHRLPSILEELGLGDAFDVRVLAGEVGCAKPDPRIFTRALRELGVPAARALVVGDDPVRDLAGAAGAGVRAIDVRDLATLADLPDRADAQIARAR